MLQENLWIRNVKGYNREWNIWKNVFAIFAGRFFLAIRSMETFAVG